MDVIHLALTWVGWPNGEKLVLTCVQIWSRPKWAQVIASQRKCTPRLAKRSRKWPKFSTCAYLPLRLTRALRVPVQLSNITRQGSKIRFRLNFYGRQARAWQKLLDSFFGKISFYFKEKRKLPNFLKITISRTILLNKFESLACKNKLIFDLKNTQIFLYNV